MASKHHALLLANHGPVVAGDSLANAVYATEELEETAKLFTDAARRHHPISHRRAEIRPLGPLVSRTTYVVTVTFDIELEHYERFLHAMARQAHQSLTLQSDCTRFDEVVTSWVKEKRVTTRQALA